jgi:hypothetical protein
MGLSVRIDHAAGAVNVAPAVVLGVSAASRSTEGVAAGVVTGAVATGGGGGATGAETPGAGRQAPRTSTSKSR